MSENYQTPARTGASTIAIVLALGAFAYGQASLDTFQSDTVGSQPANWTISGANGTSITGNVASEGGGNHFLAARDTSSSANMSARRIFAGATQGFVRFDIRFNQGVDSATSIELFTASGLQPVNLSWFHNANNTSTPLLFRSRGNGSGFGQTDPTRSARSPIISRSAHGRR
jgi:hypothetical protein